MTSLVEKFNDRVVRMNFNAKARIEFYETISLLIGNGVKLSDALAGAYNVYSEDGKNPGAPLAVICSDLIAGLKSGQKLSDVLSRYVDHTESSLIAGGEVSGDMRQAFEYAVKVITKKGEIRGAVIMATAYPGFLSIMMVYLINMVAKDLVPKFAKMSNPATWEGAAHILYQMGQFVQSYGAVSLVVVVMVVAVVVGTLPTFRGELRVRLDKFFPWSLYRMLHGSTFLLNVAVMVGSGIQMQSALQKLAQHANPWLKERISAAVYGVTIGANFGQALKDTGYDFPDEKSVRYLQLIANQDGFDKAVTNFAERWMDETVKQAQALGKTVLGVGIGLIGALMLLIMTGANDIASTIQNAAR